MAQQGQDPEILKQVHGILLTIAWFLLQNLGIWSLYFKNTPYGLYLHAFFMAMVGFINAVAPILMIARFGPHIILQYYFHHTWGFILYIIFPFLLISGTICLISKFRPSILPQVVRFRTIGHSIFGWVFILLVKVPLLIGWRLSDKESSGNILFGVIIAVEVCSYSLYLYLKFKREKIEQSPQQKSIPSLGLRSIKSLRDLRIYSNNFFIFENRVFNISQILATHPGGWEIIQAIKGREVDRFLYGVDPIQFYDVPKVSHSFDSINLAGPPIAILQIPRIFSIRQFNKGQVSLITCHDKDLKIHTIYLQLNHEKCKFSGYSDILQLGQYYSLTLDRKKTRLYTIVNFLQPENVKLIMNISKGQIQFKRKAMFSINKLDNDLDNEDKFLDIQLIKNQKDLNNTTFVTLLMKKYNDGQFTSQFLNPNHQFIEVIISQPRGLGLSLDCISSNNIVIFAGGTGLYPFSDFIDLFFKAKLVEDQHPMSNIILDSDPVLKKRPFTNLIINLYIAVNQLDELHPITLYQCNQLSKGGHFKCHAKVKGVNLTKLKEKYPNITLQASRFEAIVDKHCNEDRETMFYMCGPVRFTKSIVHQLKKNNMPESYYLIV